MTKKATTYLETDDRDLLWVCSKVKALEELDRAVKAYLEPGLAKHCQVANCAENKLVLLVANGSIGTQLRYQTMDLLQRFKGTPALQHIREVEVKVRPVEGEIASKKVSRKKMALSAENAAMIQQMAEGLEDLHLREIMQRIARNKGA